MPADLCPVMDRTQGLEAQHVPDCNAQQRLALLQVLKGSNKQRTPRLGLRARAHDLPLQASRTCSHNLELASPSSLQPHAHPRYLSHLQHPRHLIRKTLSSFQKLRA